MESSRKSDKKIELLVYKRFYTALSPVFSLYLYDV